MLQSIAAPRLHFGIGIPCGEGEGGQNQRRGIGFFQNPPVGFGQGLGKGKAGTTAEGTEVRGVCSGVWAAISPQGGSRLTQGVWREWG